jgi:ATP-dependent Clp protease adapter protein ClpS
MPNQRLKIVFLNDDDPPMEFVLHVLEYTIGVSKGEAVRLMLETHRRGALTVATLDKARAEAAAKTIDELARDAGHPFSCLLEPE